MIPRGLLTRNLTLPSILVVIAIGGCAGMRSAHRPLPCEGLDSLLAGSGFEHEVHMTGRATIDADEQRLQGKILLQARPGGDVTFDFTSTILFGTQREDFVFSLIEDTLRVIDRERGYYYEGSEAEEFLQASLEMEFEVANALHLMLGKRPACDALQDVETNSDGTEVTVRGSSEGKAFHLRFDAVSGRLNEATWPIRLDGATTDRLELEYRWSGPRDDPQLEGVVMRLEDRRWRCRLVAAN